jgi:hypothetical protein
MNFNRLSPAVEAVGDELLDRNAVADIFKISPNALNVSQFRGTFPVAPIRVGHRLRWRASDIRHYLATAGDGPAAMDREGV